MSSEDVLQNRPQRRDGRKALLVYLEPSVIEQLKIEALKQSTPAYLIVERMLKQHFDAQSPIE